MNHFSNIYVHSFSDNHQHFFSLGTSVHFYSFALVWQHAPPLDCGNMSQIQLWGFKPSSAGAVCFPSVFLSSLMSRTFPSTLTVAVLFQLQGNGNSQVNNFLRNNFDRKDCLSWCASLLGVIVKPLALKLLVDSAPSSFSLPSSAISPLWTHLWPPSFHSSIKLLCYVSEP